jgi:hypothetical protein
VNSKTNQRSCSGYLFAVAEETTHQILPQQRRCGVCGCKDCPGEITGSTNTLDSRQIVLDISYALFHSEI